MLLLPLNREGGGPRGVPWLTVAIIVVNVAGLVAVMAATDDSAVEQRVGALVQFVRAHPYLELSPAAAGLLSDTTLDRLEDARDRALASGVPPMDAFEEARHELESQEAAVFEALRHRPTHRWGFVPRDPWSVTLLTSLFMHAGWMHLIGNMLFLWITAPFVEERLGPPGFGAFFLASGLAGHAAHWMRYPGADIPLVGASGAVAGCMGAFAVFFVRSRIRFLILPLPIVVALPVLVVMPIWLGEQMWLSRYADGSNVAFGAHVGGFLFGLAVAGLVRLREGDEPERLATGAVDVRARLEQAIEAGDVRAMDEAGPQAFAALGRDGSAGAAALAREVRARVRPPLPLRLWAACASALERSAPDEALSFHDDVVRAAPREMASLRALVRRGEVCRRLGRQPEARRALQQALGHAACTEALRDSISRSLAALTTPADRGAGDAG